MFHSSDYKKRNRSLKFEVLEKKRSSIKMTKRCRRKAVKRDDDEDKSTIVYSLRSRNIIKPKTPPPPPPPKSQTPPPNPKTEENELEPLQSNLWSSTTSIWAGEPLLFNPTSARQQPQSGSIHQPQSKEDMGALIRKRKIEHIASLNPDFDAVREYNYNQWVSWANKALEHYNSQQGANFKLVNLIGVVSNSSMPRRLVHINFGAKSDDGSHKDFFAEMRVPWNENDEPIVNGCCTLEKTDSGEDLKARPCSLCHCYGLLFHPTRRYGYRVTSGDPFTALASYY